MRNDLTQDEVIKAILYDPQTGVCSWKRNRKNSIINSKTSTNYYRIGINGHRYKLHRVIWLYMTGECPAGQIDHINGDRLDNRWCNLREVTNKQNQKNIKRHKNNTSGITGVSFIKGRWKASIGVDYKTIYLGTFINKEDAIKARKSAEIEYNFHENHGRH